jgi:homoserine kinase type II
MARDIRLNQHEIREIASHYNLSVIEFESIPGGNANSSFLLYTRHGNFVLTVFTIELEQVQRLGQLLVLLEEHEFPTTRLLRLQSGDKVTMHMGKPVIMKHYISGQVRNDLNEAMLIHIGRSMAHLHEIPAPGFLVNEHEYGLEYFSTIIGREVKLEYETWLSDRLNFLKDRIHPGLPRGLIHGDVFYDNVLFDGKDFKAIIDFESGCNYYYLFDLGMGIVGLCAENSVIPLGKTKAFVDGYQQIRRLEEIEKISLQLFVEYAAIATSSWRFWKYNIDSPSLGKGQLHMQMMDIAEHVNKIPQKEFLETIFS